MGNSLFEQLKKSGLVDEKKAKKAKQSQYKGKDKKAKKGTPKPLSEATLLVQKTQAEKVARDRQLNQQQKDEAGLRAIAAQIRQLIESNRVEGREGDIVYNFVDDKVVKQLHVTAQVHKSITSGRLAIARLGQGYELVPRPVAEKIMQRDEHCIIVADVAADAVVDDDDPYADYTIPDDLMW